MRVFQSRTAATKTSETNAKSAALSSPPSPATVGTAGLGHRFERIQLVSSETVQRMMEPEEGSVASASAPNPANFSDPVWLANVLNGRGFDWAFGGSLALRTWAEHYGVNFQRELGDVDIVVSAMPAAWEALASNGVAGEPPTDSPPNQATNHCTLKGGGAKVELARSGGPFGNLNDVSTNPGIRVIGFDQLVQKKRDTIKDLLKELKAIGNYLPHADEETLARYRRRLDEISAIAGRLEHDVRVIVEIARQKTIADAPQLTRTSETGGSSSRTPAPSFGPEDNFAL